MFTLEDLRASTMTNTIAGTPEYQRVGFELQELRHEATMQSEKLRKPAETWFPRGPMATDQTETFALGWACWRRGLNAEAFKLYTEARRAHSQPSSSGKAGIRAFAAKWFVRAQDSWRQFTSKTPPNRPARLREAVEADLSRLLLWQAILDFGNTSITRTQLLAQCEAIAKHFPNSEHHQSAMDTAKILRRMVAEDLVHQVVASNTLAQMSVENRVRDLIFQLRDQHGVQNFQPGWCDILCDGSRNANTNTPAHELARLGYDAVPQLIASLDDDTFSRSVGYHRNFYFSHEVLSVGDCVAQILERITGYSAFGRRWQASGPSARRMGELWWAEFQKKGEMQMLIQGVTGAGDDAPSQAELLVKHFPAVACQTLVQGAQAATNEYIRTRLVEQIAYLKEPSGTEFLHHEMAAGPMLASRVAAARGLLPDDSAAALDAMSHEWEQLPDPIDKFDDAWEGVVEFLAQTDSTEAIAFLTKGLRTRPVEMRCRSSSQLVIQTHRSAVK